MSAAPQFDVIEAGKKLHAAKYNVEADKVTVVRMELSQLLQMGTLIDVDVNGISQFTTSASFEELGIPMADSRASRFTTGRKYLIPRKYVSKIQSIDVRYRSNLVTHSHDIEGFRPWRYLLGTAIEGQSAYEKWLEAHIKLDAELQTIVDSICDNWASIRDELISDFTKIGFEAWDALSIRSGLPAAVSLTWLSNMSPESNPLDEMMSWVAVQTASSGAEYRAAVTNPDAYVFPVSIRLPDGSRLYPRTKGSALNTTTEPMRAVAFDSLTAAQDWAAVQISRRLFVDRIVAKALAKLPTPETIRSTVRATYRTGFLLNQHALTAEVAQASLLEVEARERKIAVTKAEQQIAAMKAAEMAHARDQLNQIASPFAEVMNQMRSRIFEDVTSLKSTLDKHGFLPGRAAERAKGIRELYHLLACERDEDLEAGLKALEDALAPKSTKTGGKTVKYDVGAVSAALIDIANVTHVSVENAMQHQYAGFDSLEI
jgi:hypothetical protein